MLSVPRQVDWPRKRRRAWHQGPIFSPQFDTRNQADAANLMLRAHPVQNPNVTIGVTTAQYHCRNWATVRYWDFAGILPFPLNASFARQRIADVEPEGRIGAQSMPRVQCHAGTPERRA